MEETVGLGSPFLEILGASSDFQMLLNWSCMELT